MDGVRMEPADNTDDNPNNDFTFGREGVMALTDPAKAFIEEEVKRYRKRLCLKAEAVALKREREEFNEYLRAHPATNIDPPESATVCEIDVHVALNAFGE